MRSFTPKKKRRS